ncbi:hypothetical protein N0V84_010548 [Fusarium piperis]|uniref:Uncharacterized protein n=1 Tax=Fusarium piperis TaxID=1435070 RepID=A0A9W8TFY9_9HYPO|nr:hypothetical protein N0V84_010548 [Fusarium piperis]
MASELPPGVGVEVSDVKVEMPDRDATSHTISSDPSNLRDELLQAIENIQVDGTFASSSAVNRLAAGVFVHGVGPPGAYGKRSETIVDTAVRNTWELDPSQFELRDSTWPAQVEILCKQVAKTLGINGTIKAELYKMLTYRAHESLFVTLESILSEAWNPTETPGAIRPVYRPSLDSAAVQEVVKVALQRERFDLFDKIMALNPRKLEPGLWDWIKEWLNGGDVSQRFKAIQKGQVSGVVVPIIAKHTGSLALAVSFLSRLMDKASNGKLPMESSLQLYRYTAKSMITSVDFTAKLIQRATVAVDAALDYSIMSSTELSRYQKPFTTFFKAYLGKYVGREPVNDGSLVRPVVNCHCGDCEDLNEFLADPSREVGCFAVNKQRRAHLH